MATDITLRSVKAAALTHAEMDQNFESLSGTVDAQTTNYTILVTDQNKTIEFNGSSLTATLPTLASANGTDTDSFRVTIKNIHSTALTVDGNGAETIEGAATVTLSQWESATFQLNSGATEWNIHGRGLTVPNSVLWTSNNDGAGSGLDADLLDAQQGSYYLSRANHTGTQTMSTISDAGTLATANSVNQSTIDASAVGQGELKTTTSTVSTNTSLLHTAFAGGSYGFWPRIKTSQGLNRSYVAAPADFLEVGGTYSDNAWALGTSYDDRITIGSNNSDATISAEQTYIQASPPYDLGDGEIPLFIFLHINDSGKIRSVYEAPEAPWHYNGPTSIKADFYKSGKAYQYRKSMDHVPFTYDEAKQDVEKLKEYIREFNLANNVSVEITQKIKNQDMDIIPVPFLNIPKNEIVMLDPVCDLCWELFWLKEHDKADVASLIMDGFIKIDINAMIKRNGPTDIKVASFKWKNT